MPEIRIISIGTKMPQWVNSGVENYTSRVPKSHFELNLIEISPLKRKNTSSIKKLIEQESEKVLSAIPKHYLHISLERTGKRLSSEQMAKQMGNWLDDGQSVAISIGGPEGFPGSHFNNCNQLWSISDLTLAHPVVRIVIAEQIYRAYSILIGHPYHRGSCL